MVALRCAIAGQIASSVALADNINIRFMEALYANAIYLKSLQSENLLTAT
jgi:hypothetical protein